MASQADVEAAMQKLIDGAGLVPYLCEVCGVTVYHNPRYARSRCLGSEGDHKPESLEIRGDGAAD